MVSPVELPDASLPILEFLFLTSLHSIPSIRLREGITKPALSQPLLLSEELVSVSDESCPKCCHDSACYKDKYFPQNKESEVIALALLSWHVCACVGLVDAAAF